MSRAAQPWPALRSGLAPLALVLACRVALAQSVPAELVIDGPLADPRSAQFRACSQLAHSPWPTTAVARRAQLQRFESARSLCMDQPDFLAVLGALWLEEGEPDQALIWLERALLLDPGNLGAQADNALALQALGQPEALTELSRAWRSRTDIPAKLRSKLTPDTPITASTPLPAVRLGRDIPNGHWASHREATMLLGYETNLDHSPRLAEITLTVPEGPIDLPLLNPLTPRRGAAALTELSWQVARSPEAGRIWRAGVNVGARAATAQSKTDWHHVQLAGSGSQQWGPWRGQLELSSTWIGGPLNEPYRLLRVSATGERDALGCTLRLAAETEAHTQQVTSSSDGRTVGVLWSSLCPLAFARNWAWGAAVRASVDQPVDANRPGGTQRQWSIGTRLLGNVGAGVRIDLSARVTRVQDDEGYSALLESNAARRLSQSQVSLELTRPLNLSWWPGAEALLQWQAVRQASNLSVFRYSGLSGYGGIRWAW